MYKMPKTKIPNKYNLTISDIRKLVVNDRSLVGAPKFWRNDVIKAWCLIEHFGTVEDERCGADNEFWIGIYDEDAPAYAGKFRFTFSTYGGMCGYNFTEFFRPEDIDNEMDYQLQKKFLEMVTEFIDQGILKRV